MNIDIKEKDLKLLKKAKKEALSVLKKNAHNCGFSASTERYANYFSVWARDHSITALAAIKSGDKELINASLNGIFTLLNAQSKIGQVPAYIDVENGKREYGGLGTITAIDSNMWGAIAAAELFKATHDKRFMSKTKMQKYEKLYNMLSAMDSNEDGFVEVHVAGDWADTFTRTYHVLYDEVLYYDAIRALKYLYSHSCDDCKVKTRISKNFIKKLTSQSTKTKKRVNDILWLTPNNIQDIKEKYMIESSIPSKKYNYYQSHLQPFKHEWANRVDVLGNVLAIRTGVANKKRALRIVKHLLRNKVNEPFPIRALDPPVMPNDLDWEPLYVKHEKPYEYHNGAIWPMITGFWIEALCKINLKEKAVEELISIAKAMKKDDWKFHEHYNGITGEPLGRTEQAWSASGFLLGYYSCGLE